MRSRRRWPMLAPGPAANRHGHADHPHSDRGACGAAAWGSDRGDPPAARRHGSRSATRPGMRSRRCSASAAASTSMEVESGAHGAGRTGDRACARTAPAARGRDGVVAGQRDRGDQASARAAADRRCATRRRWSSATAQAAKPRHTPTVAPGDSGGGLWLWIVLALIAIAALDVVERVQLDPFSRFPDARRRFCRHREEGGVRSYNEGEISWLPTANPPATRRRSPR